MDPTKEALGRVVIAEFETRRLAEHARVRSARLRFAFELGCAMFVAAICILFQQHYIRLSRRDWLFIGGVYLISTRWSAYQMREDLIALRAEIDKLKAARKDKDA